MKIVIILHESKVVLCKAWGKKAPSIVTKTKKNYFRRTQSYRNKAVVTILL